MTLQRGQNDTPQYIHYVHDQIKKAGLTFVSEAESYRSSMNVFGDPIPKARSPRAGGQQRPPTGTVSIQIPSGGDALVDQSLATVLGLTYDTHQLVSDAMNWHGAKMADASDRLLGADAKVVDAIYNFLGGVSSGEPPVDPLPASPDGSNPDFLSPVTSKVGSLAYRPMPKSFATPQVGQTPGLAPFQRDLVGGDPNGLVHLAQALTGFVQGPGNHTVNFLKKTVESLVKDDDDYDGYHSSDGGWSGSAAYAFRTAYIVDASVMNGLHCTMCKMAGIINEFAAALASAENGLERALYAVRGLVQRYVAGTPGSTTSALAVSDYLGYFSAGRSGGRQQLLVGLPVGMALKTLLGTIAKPFFEKAEQARHTAASRLAAMGEILLSGVTYYDGHASNTDSGPGVFISRDQYGRATGAHSLKDPNLKTLSSNLFTDESQLKMKNSDTGAMTNDLTSLGLDAANAGSLIGDVQSYRAAETALPKVGGIANFLGAALPIIAEIGMAAA